MFVWKYKHTDWEKVSLIADDMIVFVENPKESTTTKSPKPKTTPGANKQL